MFYDSFSYDLSSAAGAALTPPSHATANFSSQYPQFYLFNIPATLPQSNQPSNVSNPNLRAPYTSRRASAWSGRLTKSANLSVTYLTSRGVSPVSPPLNLPTPSRAHSKNGLRPYFPISV